MSSLPPKGSRHQVMEALERRSHATEGSVVSCANCRANCCRLEVMLMGEDEPPVEFIMQDPWGGWIMKRLEDGWCAALDRKTMMCTIYERRPTICRDFGVGDTDCLHERRLQPIDTADWRK